MAQLEIFSAGTAFGKLTVLEFAGTRRGQGIHECECECGRRVLAFTSRLKHGMKRSCGNYPCRGGRWKGGSKNAGTEAWSNKRLGECRRNSRLGGYAMPLGDWTRVQYLWNESAGKCACCKEKGRGRRNLHLDHCHKTGKLRGFICMRCNHVLGKAHDNPDVLMRIAKYAAVHQQSTLPFTEEAVA